MLNERELTVEVTAATGEPQLIAAPTTFATASIPSASSFFHTQSALRAEISPASRRLSCGHPAHTARNSSFAFFQTHLQSRAAFVAPSYG